MPNIVQILYSAPSMNTHSKKKLPLQNPMNPQFGQGNIDSQQYFFKIGRASCRERVLMPV